MTEYKKNLRTITTTQAAEILGVTTSAIRGYIVDGKLAGVQPKFRAHMQVDLAAVQELAAERQRIVAMRLEQQAKRTRSYAAAHGLDIAGAIRISEGGTALQPVLPPAVVRTIEAQPGPASIVKRLDRIEALLQRIAAAWDI